MADIPPKKKKKPSNPVTDYLLYLLVRTVGVFVQMGHVDKSLATARLLGRGLFRLYGRGRQRALEHLAHAYPEKSSAWRERTARRSFEHLVMFAFDVFFTPRLVRPSNWRNHVRFGNMSGVLRRLLNGRGVIMITGHYGSFEVLGRAMDVFGLAMVNIARPIDNPYINRYVYEKLHRPETIVFKKGAAQVMQQVLTTGSALGVVGDQNGKSKDIFVDFFGRQAATYKSVALMAMQYDVPIVVGCARRREDRYLFDLEVTRVLEPDEWRDRDDPLHWITAEWTAAIEQFVRREPEQYWWIHRRWKTRPAAERAAG